MPKHRPRVQMGSLSSMASRIRDEKAASKTKLSSSSQVQTSQKLAEDSTSSSGSDNGSSDDSDGSGSGSDLEAARKKYTAQQASKRKSAKPKEATAKSEPTKSTLNTIIPVSPQASTKPTNGQTQDSDSDSDSQSDSDTTSQSSDSDSAPAQNAATEGSKAEREAESESDSESSGDSESEADEATSAKQPAEAESSSDEASESGSSDASEESEEEADVMEVDGDEMAVSRVNGHTSAHDSASEVSRPSWLNNSNFVLRKASSDNPGKEVTEFLSKSNLEGKQVWYFTAPASLPITVLKDMQIDLSKVQSGEALLNHKGDDYGLDLEANATNTQIQLLIPSQAGDNYTALNRGIDSTVHIRHIAKFGPGSATSATATKDYNPIPKPIREQPQGLKPRFTPIGVPNPTPSRILPAKPKSTPVAQDVSSRSESESEPESESESDEDMTPSQPPLATSSTSSKKHKKLDAVNGKLKRKHPSDEENQSTPVRESQSQEKSTKRPKTSKSTPKASSSKKEAPVQIAALSTPKETPSKKAKANKEKSKYAIKPTKQTPVPPPTFPSMNR
ncbi:DNA-directed RNA polymerase I subunit RPA34.5-domain-containing protein [Hypomontagnella monticulosa]|nr:DNA-directed RNA polymerase I subunit RPA34.5-domain-containing protein [Hypomontagnella monticulosa]